MIRYLAQDLPIGFLRFGQAPGLVVLYGRLYELLNGNLRH